MSKKIKTAFVCDQCGADYPRWGGQCTSCGEWNTIKEIRLGSEPAEHNSRKGYAGSRSEVKLLSDVNLSQAERITTGISEFDRVLGGGIVRGSVVLIGVRREQAKARFYCKRLPILPIDRSTYCMYQAKNHCNRLLNGQTG